MHTLYMHALYTRYDMKHKFTSVSICLVIITILIVFIHTYIYNIYIYNIDNSGQQHV